jgi:hypothetical protein
LSWIFQYALVAIALTQNPLESSSARLGAFKGADQLATYAEIISVDDLNGNHRRRSLKQIAPSALEMPNPELSVGREPSFMITKGGGFIQQAANGEVPRLIGEKIGTDGHRIGDHLGMRFNRELKDFSLFSAYVADRRAEIKFHREGRIWLSGLSQLVAVGGVPDWLNIQVRFVALPKLGARYFVGSLGGFQRFFGLLKSNENKDYTDERQCRRDSPNDIPPPCGLRSFFGRHGGAPLGAQIGAVVVFCLVTAVGLFVGIGRVIGGRNSGWLHLTYGLFFYGLLVWWSSPA